MYNLIAFIQEISYNCYRELIEYYLEKRYSVEQGVLLKVYNPRQRAIIMQLIAAILWSFGGPLIKLVDLNPIAIAGLRSFIASFIILLFLKNA